MAIELAAATNKPFYIRFGKKAMPLLPTAGNGGFSFGKGRMIKEGNDITIIATGEAVYPAWQAAKLLGTNYGVHAAVVSMHTIKPLDHELIENLASNGNPVITVEEHSVFGGLGEACASFMMQNGFTNKFKIIAIPDEYTVTGSQNEIFAHYGISEKGIAKSALEILEHAAETIVI